MALFFKNVCSYRGCSKEYPSLGELIVHIEDTHIDFDPKIVEEKERQKLQYLPLSLVLRYNRYENNSAKGESDDFSEDSKSKGYYGVDDLNSSTISGSSTLTEELNNNWYTDKMVPCKKDFIDQKIKTKRFCCPVTGCTKRYKNQNGMKYHIVNFHDMEGNTVKPKKDFKCHCGREYKTLRGLQSHCQSTHGEPHIQRVSRLDHVKLKPFAPILPRTNLTRLFPKINYKRPAAEKDECFAGQDMSSFSGNNHAQPIAQGPYFTSLTSTEQQPFYSNQVYSESSFENNY